jgi:Thioredoxin
MSFLSKLMSMKVPKVCMLTIVRFTRSHLYIYISNMYAIYIVAAKYNVSAMPTFVLIKSGQVIDRLMGANVERLRELIDENK